MKKIIRRAYLAATTYASRHRAGRQSSLTVTSTSFKRRPADSAHLRLLLRLADLAKAKAKTAAISARSYSAGRRRRLGTQSYALVVV